MQIVIFLLSICISAIVNAQSIEYTSLQCDLVAWKSNLITAQNRAMASMWGAWGSHLRGIMRENETSVWFFVDQGQDVSANTGALFFNQNAAASLNWSHASAWQVVNLNGIQQNVAGLYSAGFIWTYGVNIKTSTLQECYFLTKQPGSYQACNQIVVSGVPLTLPLNSNYIGAAVSDQNTKLVWWITVGSTGYNGIFSYIYNFNGAGWNGPVSSDLTSIQLGDVSYLYGKFLSANTFRFTGEGVRGPYTGTYTFEGVVGDIILGQPLDLYVMPPAPSSPLVAGDDMVLDKATGGAHWLVRTSQGMTAYYFKSSTASWATASSKPVAEYNVFRSRFIENDQIVCLVLSINGNGNGAIPVGAKVYCIHRFAIPNGPINWTALPCSGTPTGLESLGTTYNVLWGLYTEGKAYNSNYRSQNLTSQLSFAAIPQSPNDNQVMSFTFDIAFNLTSPTFPPTRSPTAASPPTTFPSEQPTEISSLAPSDAPTPAVPTQSPEPTAASPPVPIAPSPPIAVGTSFPTQSPTSAPAAVNVTWSFNNETIYQAAELARWIASGQALRSTTRYLLWEASNPSAKQMFKRASANNSQIWTASISSVDPITTNQLEADALTAWLQTQHVSLPGASTSPGGLSAGAIVAIALGALLAMALVVFLLAGLVHYSNSVEVKEYSYEMG